MLQIKHLTVSHKKDLKTILEDFSLVLQTGDKAVVIGEEGNGKSTLLKLIYDESLVSDYIEYTGDIIKNNLRLGYLEQELPAESKGETVYSYCAEFDGFFDSTPKDLAQIARALGLETDFFYSDRLMAVLSGGEKVKLRLAMILLSKPDVLLLDEPSNDIDIETLEWLEQFIKTCDLPILYVSHDETLIEHTANLIVHLEQLRRKTLPRCTVTRASYDEYISRRETEFSHQSQMAKNEQREYEKQQKKFLQIQSKVEHRQNVISRADPAGGRLLKKKMKSVKSMERRFEKEYEQRTRKPESEDAVFMYFPERISLPNNKTIAEIHVDTLYAEQTILAENIDLVVKGSEKIGIVGKNGAGKTTLIKQIAEQLLARRDIKAAYMPQDYEELLDLNKTPVEFLERTGDKQELTRIRTCLGSVKYTEQEMSHTVSELSGGQKAKLLFVKMILDENDVLILDEPTRNFSPLSNPVVRRILKQFGGAIISVSHDRKYLSEVCDKVFRLTESGLV